MQNWLKKSKIMTYALFVAGASLVLYFGGLYVVFGKIGQLEDFYSNTESKFFQNKKLLDIQKTAETKAGLIADLRGFFIQKDDEVEFIEEVERAARDSSLEFSISSIEVKTDPESSFKEDIEVKMSISGSWSAVMSFLDKLEKMKFGVTVRNLGLDADSDGWSGLLQFFVFREK